MGVALRPYAQSDLEPFAALFGDAEVMRYVGDGRPLERDAAAQLLAKVLEIYQSDPAFFVWAIEESGEYAGHAELKRRKGREEYELIYFLQRKRWGRSLGGQVVDMLLAEARRRAIPLVIATVEAENVASGAILARRGFERDAALSTQLECAAYRLQLTQR